MKNNINKSLTNFKKIENPGRFSKKELLKKKHQKSLLKFQWYFWNKFWKPPHGSKSEIFLKKNLKKKILKNRRSSFWKEIWKILKTNQSNFQLKFLINLHKLRFANLLRTFHYFTDFIKKVQLFLRYVNFQTAFNNI